MIGFKYIEKEYVAGVLEGRFQLGTPTYYHEMEEPFRDDYEARLFSKQKDGWYDPKFASAEESKELARFMPLPEGDYLKQNILIGGNTFVQRLPDAWMLCLSTISDNEHFITPDINILKIDPLDLFAHRVKKANRDILGDFQISEISYQERDFIFGEKRTEVPSYFIKRQAYEVEKEIRIVWADVSKNGSATYISNAGKACRPVELIG